MSSRSAAQGLSSPVDRAPGTPPQSDVSLSPATPLMKVLQAAATEPSPAVVPFAHFEQLRLARQILQAEAQALLELSRRLDARFCSAIELLSSVRGDVLLTGLGKAGNIAQKVAATLRSTGTRAHFLHPVDALHGDLGGLDAGDVLLALSNSGSTAEVCAVAGVARERGIPVIAITAQAHSRLGQLADVVLELGTLLEAGLHGLPPSCSTTAMLALGDALSIVLAEQRQFTPADFAAHHPGGSLGQRLTLVREVMRSGVNVRVASDRSTIREVYTTLSQPGRRPGAIMLVDEHGALSGLFTDSDLARLLEQRRDAQLDQPICNVMTVRPLTIGPEALLEEVFQLLSAHRVSELPVVDDAGCPVGLVDITDVLALLPGETATGSAVAPAAVSGTEPTAPRAAAS